MDGFRLGLTAALSSRLFVAGLNVLMLPVYARWIGHEAFGLIGVFTTFQAVVTFMDFGLSTAFVREVADAKDKSDRATLIRNCALTCDAVYWSVAVFIGVVLSGASLLLANFWLNPDALSPRQLTVALLIASWTLAAQWPNSLYIVILTGLRQQVKLAGLSVSMAILRVLLVISALTALGASVEVFFCAMLLGSLIQTILGRMVAFGALPKGPPAQFSKAFLVRIGSFAGLMTGVGLTGILLTQADKFVLSNTLPLAEFGIYSLAAAFATGVYVVVAPLFNLIYPRVAAISLTGDSHRIEHFYHQSSQLFALLLIPAVVIASYFSEELLYVWTRSHEVAHKASVAFALLLFGNLFNGLANPTHAYQLAFGRPALPLQTNILGLVVAVPLVFYLGTRFGITGGGMAWMLVSGTMLIIGQVVTHRVIPLGRISDWFFKDIMMATMAPVAIGAAAVLLIPVYSSLILELIKFLVVWILSLFAAAMSLSEIRPRLLASMKHSRFWTYMRRI